MNTGVINYTYPKPKLTREENNERLRWMLKYSRDETERELKKLTLEKLFKSVK